MSERSAFETVGLELRATPATRLSYAFAYNKLPALREIDIVNRSGKVFSDLVLAAGVTSLGQELSDPEAQPVDGLGPGSTRIGALGLHLRPELMKGIEERRPGQVWATLSLRDGTVLVRQEWETQVLAAQQWLYDPAEPSLSGMALAAFVQPNHPEIQAVLSRARDVLKEATGSSATQGYQAQKTNPRRVDEIAGAIYEALLERDIQYSDPPASWTDQGQKIRNPEQVLVGRAGTCLDTAVTYAACLEQAGLAPLVWLIEGHAFTAYWRLQQGIGVEPVITDVDRLINFVDQDAMAAVETTTLTKGVHFDEALREGASITKSLENVESAVNVVSARLRDVVALPAVQRQEDGQVVVVEYRPAEVVLHARQDAERSQEVERRRIEDPSPQRFQTWKKQLLDLSRNNRLISYKRDSHGIPLHIPSGAIGVFEDILHAGRTIRLIPHDELDSWHQELGARTAQDVDTEVLTRMLVDQDLLFVYRTRETYVKDMRKLTREARSREQQSGANQLYVTLGKLHWESADGRELRSPVFLVPVRLISSGGRNPVFRLAIDESGMSTPNYSLVEKLRNDLDIVVDELSSPTTDQFGIDIEASLRALRKAITDRELTGFRVDDNAHLTIVNFTKFRLWKDLDEHWRHFEGNAVVKHLVHSPGQVFQDPAESSRKGHDVPPARCAIPADGSQLSAIGRAVRGDSFVLEGPPGTGKSQTITNVIAANMAAGRTVLFVAEKQVALDVVRSRLESIGLGPLCLDLHAKGAKVQQLRDQILEGLDYRPVRDRDAYEAAEARRAAAEFQLERYARALHQPNAMGFSVWAARQTILRLGDGPTAVVPDAFLTQDRRALDTVAAALRDLPGAVADAGVSARHPWALAGVGDIDPSAHAELRSTLPALQQALSGLMVSAPIEAVLNAARSMEDLATLVHVMSGETMRASDLMQIRTPAWQQMATGMINEVSAAVHTAPAVLSLFAPEVQLEDLDTISAAVTAAAQAGVLSRNRRLKDAAGPLVRHQRAGAPIPPKDVAQVVNDLIAARDQARVIRAHVASVPGLEMPRDWNPWTPDAAKHLHARANNVHDLAVLLTEDSEFGVALTALATSANPPSAFELAAVRVVSEAWHRFAGVIEADADSIGRWRDGRSFLTAWRDSQPMWDQDLGANLLRLRRWCRLNAAFTPLNEAGLSGLVSDVASGWLPVEQADDAFRRGLAAATLRHEMQARALDAFDGKRHDRTVEQFGSADHELLSQESVAIAADIVAARRADTASRIGPVGALRLELTKTRGRKKGIRALLEEYPETMQDLMPCFMMSPDSVASFLQPSRVSFDVVIFDEASQITVAEAIGAMGRARSVIVVGDSRQMPPSDAGSAFSFEDDELTTVLDVDPVITDAESILTECVESGLEREWLSWHYRSKDESLISFSNHHYYDSKLSSFPSPKLPATSTGVRLVRVDGEYVRSGKRTEVRRNPVEAAAIVAEIEQRFQQSETARWSMGVVTFNKEQMELIDTMLSRSKVEGVAEALKRGHENDPTGLIVRNLENVQGDERDVILFSVAFSPLEPGGTVPLRMGALTHQGGERRLNVAVTRAKREVIVYCSFDPDQLKPQKETGLGIRHLKAYLEMAAGLQEQELDSAAAGTDLHLEEIRERLAERGLVSRPNVGLSDFKVDLAVSTAEHPDVEVVGILLDGPAWRDRKNANDRDQLPISVLEGVMGWPRIMRIWLPSWLVEADAILDEIEAATHREVPLALARAAEAAAEAEQLAAAQREGLAAAQDSGRVGAATEAGDVALPDIPAMHLLEENRIEDPGADAAQSHVLATGQPDEVVDSNVGTSHPIVDQVHGPGEVAGGFVRPDTRDDEPAMPSPVVVPGVPVGPALAPYTAWVSRPVPPVHEASREELAAILEELVHAEGPILAGYAYRKYVRASGGQRVGSAIKTHLNRATAALVRTRRIAQVSDGISGQIGKTLHVPGGPPVVLREPGERDLFWEVPPGEVRALLEMLGMREGQPTELVMREALRIYGAGSLTQQRITFLHSAATYSMR